MKFHVLTLFPEMVEAGLDGSILKRAKENGLIQIHGVNIRDYSLDKHKSVDDYTYGGGAGMLIQAQPVYDAWKAVCGEKKIRTIYCTPQGCVFNQQMAKDFSKEEELIVLCGHYEGIDERVLEEVVTDYVSIGDYVLTGGELAAMVMIDSISRFVDGVLNNSESALTESFHLDLLEYPQYTRPEVWHEKAVPKVLMSGNHKDIEAWRRERSIERTEKFRPDLLIKYREREAAIKALMKQKKENAYMIDALLRGVAYVVDRQGSNVLAYNEACKTWMICGEDCAVGQRFLEQIPAESKLFLNNMEALNPFICEKFGVKCSEPYCQSVYTGHEALPVEYKEIRTLTMEDDLDYIVSNYEHGSVEFVEDRIRAREMFGAFSEGRLVAFCGIHNNGSLGILYVEPEFRCGHMGGSLASYLVNKALERGGIPYAHILATNKASLRMQERMGLYLGKKYIYWLYESHQDAEAE